MAYADPFVVVKDAVEYQFQNIRPINLETTITEVLDQVRGASRYDIAQTILNSTGVWMEECIHREDVVTFADVARVLNEGGDGFGEYPY